MKKLLLLLLLIAVPVFADIEQETQEFETNTGAQLRLLQFEKQLTKSIYVGETVIAKIEEVNEDATILYDIISELTDIQAQVQQLNTEQDNVDDIDEYVTLRQTAGELVLEFRNEASGKLTEAQKQEVREQIDSQLDEVLEEVNEKIVMLKNEHHAQQLAKVLQRLGVDDPNLVQDVEEGKMSLVQIKERLRTKITDMAVEQRDQRIQEVRKLTQERVDNAKARIESAQAKVQERLVIAEQKRSELRRSGERIEQRKRQSNVSLESEVEQ